MTVATCTCAARRAEDSLTQDDRRVARDLRAAARTVAAAGLPAEYRPLAYLVLLLERDVGEASTS